MLPHLAGAELPPAMWARPEHLLPARPLSPGGQQPGRLSDLPSRNRHPLIVPKRFCVCQYLRQLEPEASLSSIGCAGTPCERIERIERRWSDWDLK